MKTLESKLTDIKSKALVSSFFGPLITEVGFWVGRLELNTSGSAEENTPP